MGLALSSPPCRHPYRLCRVPHVAQKELTAVWGLNFQLTAALAWFLVFSDSNNGFAKRLVLIAPIYVILVLILT